MDKKEIKRLIDEGLFQKPDYKDVYISAIIIVAIPAIMICFLAYAIH